MKRKIIGSFIVMFLIATATLPVIGTNDIKERNFNNYDSNEFYNIDCPDDFELDAYGGGFAPWTNWYRIQIDNEGHGVYLIMYAEDRNTSDFTEIDQFDLTQNEMNQLWNQIESSDFFNLNSMYSESDIFTDSDIEISEGSFANVTITGNNNTNTVETQHIGVPEFDEIMSKINSLTPGDYDLFYQGVNNNPPFRPLSLSGQTNGKPREEYTYTTLAADIDQDKLYYQFDWGDNTQSEWIGPFDSGENVSVKHEWSKKGNYNIIAQVKDDPNNDGDLSDGVESGWSDPLPVSMPKGKIQNTFFLKLLSRIIDQFPILDYYLHEIYNQGFPKLKLANIGEIPYPTEITQPDAQCKIKIILRIQIWGDGASNDTANKIKQDITNKFGSGWKIKCKDDCVRHDPGCSIEFEIIVKYDWKNGSTRPPRGNGYHPWYIGNDPNGDKHYGMVYTVDSNKSDDLVDYPRANDRETDRGDPQTISNGGADGYMDNNEPTGTYAHEAGHLLGLADQYNTSNENDANGDGRVDADEKDTKPKKGHENDIMGTLSGSLQQSAIEKLLKKAKIECPCRCCPEEPDNKKPENKIENPKNGSKVSSSPIIIGYADDGPTGSGVALLDFSLEWDGGNYDGGTRIVDPPLEYVSYELGPIDLELFIELGDWISITTYATDAVGNTGSDTVTVTWDEEEDTLPPITEKTIGQPQWEEGYTIASFTPILLEATDPEPGSGVNHIHYEVWQEGILMGSEDVPGDTVEMTFGMHGVISGIAELRWYAVDNADNVETMQYQEHFILY